MISPVILWITVFVVSLAAVSGFLWAWGRRPSRSPRPLPTDWQLSARPVFSTDERRVYRLLRDALPNHAVLSKLPLVRFSQPDDPNEVRYWYELLGTIHVAFAICSASGRVLAAIDLDSDRSASRRTLQIKQAVLSACRVRYLRCRMSSLPTVAEIQSLVPQGAVTSRGARSVSPLTDEALAPAAIKRPASAPPQSASRNPLWQDSNLSDDSFFALENRPEGTGTTDFGGLGSTSRTHRAADPRQRRDDRDERDDRDDTRGGVVE